MRCHHGYISIYRSHTSDNQYQSIIFSGALPTALLLPVNSFPRSTFAASKATANFCGAVFKL